MFLIESITLYVIVMFARGFVLAMLFPLGNIVGFMFDWRQKIVVAWSGLRSPILLILALLFNMYTKSDPYRLYDK